MSGQFEIRMKSNASTCYILVSRKHYGVAEGGRNNRRENTSVWTTEKYPSNSVILSFQTEKVSRKQERAHL